MSPLPEEPPFRPRRVLVIDGHPRADSLGSGLAKSFVKGAQEAGHEVRVLTLRELDFDLNERGQELEKDLRYSQECVLWAEHLTFVFPIWWGTMPALLKGWLDRVLQRDFAFTETPNGGYQGLLKGRSAMLICTRDTPQWIYRWLLGAPAIRALRDATLGFCGMAPIRVKTFGPVRSSTPPERAIWIASTAKLGEDLEDLLYTGPLPRLLTWLRLARPQFYAFPALALIAGALAARAAYPNSRSWIIVLLAWLGAALVEFITVLTNEIHDAKTDALNQHSGPFTGGSRVLPEKRLSVREITQGRLNAIVLLVILAGSLAILLPEQALPLSLILGLGAFLGWAYSAPPLRLSQRGWGEITVALTHSALVVLAGYVSQGGRWLDATPWLFIVPMFLAILPSIILAGFPDYEADKATGKRTLAVRLGKGPAAGLALLFTVAACASHVLLNLSVSLISAVIITHATALIYSLGHLALHPRRGRIDALLFLALSYMLWFALHPLLRFWSVS